jgi:ATP synthase protein I
LGASVALSVLIGSAACLVATAVFAIRVFRGYRAQSPGVLLMRFYGAEAAKLATVLGLFAIAFATIEGLSIPALLAAYFAVQVLPPIIASEWGAGPKRER